MGEWHENSWFVYEGLRAGDRVVVDGTLTLQPGTQLKVKPLVEKEHAAGKAAPGNDPTKSGQ